MEVLRIPIDAIPQARPRFVKGKVIDPPKCAKFKDDVAMLVKSLRRESALYIGELEVTIAVYRNFTKATNQRFGDADNLAKGILDALNGIVWTDDRQITALHVFKFVTDSKPYIEVTVEGR